MSAAAALQSAVDYLLPARCLGCGERIALGAPDRRVCIACRLRLRPPPSPRCPRCDFPLGTGALPREDCTQCSDWPDALSRARSAVVLEPPADALAHALKYEGWPELAPLMARPMARVHLGLPAAGKPILVPVPTTRARERERGYNQAALLGEALATLLGWPILKALSRDAARRSQVALHPSQRLANVQGVFSVGAGCVAALEDAQIVLIDDVLTTGATVGSAAQVLVAAGVKEVTALTFARALPGRGRSR